MWKPMKAPEVFKVLANKDGKLESLTTMGSNLSYAEGKVTYAPEGSMGIFVDETLEKARVNGTGNQGYKCEKKAGVDKPATFIIHRAIPLGQPLPKTGAVFGGSLRYPAILLEEEVWRAPPPTPKVEWVNVTEECTFGLMANRSGEECQALIKITHKSKVIGMMGLNQLEPMSGDISKKYKIESSESTFCKTQWFRVFHRQEVG